MVFMNGIKPTTVFFISPFPHPGAFKYSKRSFAADYVSTSGFCKVHFYFIYQFLIFNQNHQIMNNHLQFLLCTISFYCLLPFYFEITPFSYFFKVTLYFLVFLIQVCFFNLLPSLALFIFNNLLFIAHFHKSLFQFCSFIY